MIAPALAVIALLFALPGCEEDTKPKITRLEATPECDEMKTVTRVNLDPIDSSIVSIDTLGVWMEVTFFARAASGNELSEPTGANSPLEWTWNFGDGSTAKNVVGPTHRYTQAGEYTVRLSVKDDDGDEDTASMLIRVGEAYTDLDILNIDIHPAAELRFSVVPGSVATDLSQIWGNQVGLDDMDMIYEGELQTICSISGLFEQYLWDWSITNTATTDTTTIVDRNPVMITYRPRHLELDGRLHVLETVTGIERFAPAPDDPAPFLKMLNPVGLRVSNSIPRTVVPNGQDSLLLEAYLINGVEEMTFELEWADSAATLDGIAFDPGIAAEFTATTTDLGPGRVGVSLVSATGYSGMETTTKIADLNFSTIKVLPGKYPVRIREPFVMRDGDPEEGGRFTTIDGAIQLDFDCDEDGIPDSFQAEFFPAQFDCNGNGFNDTCDIIYGVSQDENGNGVPDECEG
jgi:PKD repeat protein